MDEIVRMAKEHLFRAASLPYPEGLSLTEQWRVQREKNREAILKMQTVDEAIEWAQDISKSGFNHRAIPGPNKLAQQVDEFHKRWPNMGSKRLVHESPLSRPETVVWADGLPVSNIFFWHMEALLRIASIVPKPRRIIEIGGGMGELARLAVQTGSFLWQIVDLPESLFFAEVYLKANGIGVDYELDGVAMAWGTVGLLPIQNRAWFAAEASFSQRIYADLVVSQGSFQEMTLDAVHWWLDMINSSNVKHLLSINGKESTNLSWDEEKWEVLHQEHNTESLQRVLDSGADFEELLLRRKV